MITKTQEDQLKSWFHSYVKSYQSPDPYFNQNIDLKYYHIIRVRDNIMELAENEGFSEEQIRLAGIMGLFHDIGRFKQYTVYQTFADSKSENHALLGLKELHKNQVLDSLEPKDKESIELAISNHNRKEIAEDVTGEALTYSKLLRDADKLDIWRVVLEYYEDEDGEENETIQLDLPDVPGYSLENLNALQEGKNIKMEDLATLNDFKILQAGWIFDLNFVSSFYILDRNQYIERLFKVLPNDESIRNLKDKINQYINRQLNHHFKPETKNQL